MKKILLFLAYFSIISTVVSQTTFGVKAGINLASFDDQRSVDITKRLDYHLGVLAAFEVSPKVVFQTEILYSEEGANLNNEYDANTIFWINNRQQNVHVEDDVQIKLNYVRFPFLVKYQVFEFLQAYIGPQVAFQVLAKSENEQILNHENVRTSETDLRDRMAKVELGHMMGIDFPITKHLFIEARYYMAWTFIHDTAQIPHVRNRMFQFSVGYKF